MTKNILFTAVLALPGLLAAGRVCGQNGILNYSGETDPVFKFPNAVCSRPITFENATFTEGPPLQHLTFLENAQFTDATFLRSVDFTDVHFEQQVYFDNVTFLKNVYFDNTTFSNYAKFTNLQQTDSTQMNFSDATLPDTMDFSENPSLKCNIDLTTANFTDSLNYDDKSGGYKKPHQIFLYRTDISKFHLDYFHFRLLLPDSTLSPTYTGREKISKDDKDVMYESLLNNFKLNGQMESYKQLDIEYQAFQWDHSWARWLRWVPLVWWNYGYDKEYIFIWIAGFLLIFTIINSFYIVYLNDHIYKLEDVAEKLVDAGRKEKIWHSAVYTANIFFRLTLDLCKLNFDKVIPTIYLLFMYIMGTLCIGYLANFILQK